MKKRIYLLFAGIILMMPVANAQFRFGVKGGVNIASVKFSKDVIDSDNTTGFHIGPTIELGGATPLSLDVAVLYSQKGFGYKDKSYKNDYVEVPVNLKWKPFELPLIQPYAAVGPYFSFRVAGDKVWEIPGSVREQIKSKSFNTGLNLGIGAEVLNTIQIGLTYSWGFTNNYNLEGFEFDKSSGKNRLWSISAAVFF
ncbi:MAG: PorT family protein [Tannerella sp.]|jgi:hypothetical protein|nr:PorT family protein [Tannerella sp.]